MKRIHFHPPFHPRCVFQASMKQDNQSFRESLPKSGINIKGVKAGRSAVRGRWMVASFGAFWLGGSRLDVWPSQLTRGTRPSGKSPAPRHVSLCWRNRSCPVYIEYKPCRKNYLFYAASFISKRADEQKEWPLSSRLALSANAVNSTPLTRRYFICCLHENTRTDRRR